MQVMARRPQGLPRQLYAMDLVASAELDINIPVADFHRDWTYGPKTVGTWSMFPSRRRASVSEPLALPVVMRTCMLNLGVGLTFASGRLSVVLLTCGAPLTA